MILLLKRDGTYELRPGRWRLPILKVPVLPADAPRLPRLPLSLGLDDVPDVPPEIQMVTYEAVWPNDLDVLQEKGT